MTEWRNIPSFPGYKVSDSGQVMGHRGIMAMPVDESGYYRLALYRDGKRINCRVHSLVADALLGERPSGMVIRHLDGNHLNNFPANLQWGTQSENVRDSIAHGTQRNSRKTHCHNGHEFTPENTRIESGRSRQCRACRAQRERARRARIKELAS